MQMFLDKNHFNPDCLNIYIEPGKNHRPAAGHCQPFLLNVVSCTLPHEWGSNSQH